MTINYEVPTNDPLYPNPCTKDNATGVYGERLGGTGSKGDPDSWHPEVMDFLISYYNLSSVLDFGCGVGYHSKFFKDRGLRVCSLDGFEGVREWHQCPDDLVIHDIYKGPFLLEDKPDLFWSCDVFEHIHEEHVPKIIETCKNTNKVIAFAAAPVGWGGHHHVNCQNPPYWIKKFTEAGFKYNDEVTQFCRSITPKGHNGRINASFFQRSGLVFEV